MVDHEIVSNNYRKNALLCFAKFGCFLCEMFSKLVKKLEWYQKSSTFFKTSAYTDMNYQMLCVQTFSDYVENKKYQKWMLSDDANGTENDNL